MGAVSNSRTTKYSQTADKPKLVRRFAFSQARSFAKDFGLFLFHEKGATKMYFTSTPSLNSMEAIMQRPPGGNQRGGGRIRRAYPFNKADCDCRLCLYYRKKKGCSMKVCPVLNVRLICGAASFYEAVHAAFADARHIPFQRRLSHLYDRKDIDESPGMVQSM